jgi:hypothetical protein
MRDNPLNIGARDAWQSFRKILWYYLYCVLMRLLHHVDLHYAPYISPYPVTQRWRPYNYLSPLRYMHCKWCGYGQPVEFSSNKTAWRLTAAHRLNEVPPTSQEVRRISKRLHELQAELYAALKRGKERIPNA